MIRFFLTAIITLVSLSAFADTFQLKSIEGKTIVPVEIRSQYLSCDRPSMVKAITEKDAPSPLFLGRYRDFSKAGVGSGNLEHGLVFIASEATSCDHPYANAFSIYKADMQSNTMTVMYLGLEQNNLGRAENRYQDLIGKMGSLPNSALARESIAVAKEYQRQCPWTNLQNVRSHVATAELECQLSARPTAPEQPGFVGRTVDSTLKFLRFKSSPAVPAGNIKDAENIEEYLWQADFSLMNGKGREELKETVKIQSYLVCSDASAENILVFAVMEKMMTGLKYMCK